MRRYLCGVKEGCSAPKLETPLAQPMRLHSSPEEAFECKVAELINQGYTRIGGREFSKNGGPILVITKRSRFGGMMRMGKSAEGSQTSKRCAFMKRTGGIIF